MNPSRLQNKKAEPQTLQFDKVVTEDISNFAFFTEKVRPMIDQTLLGYNSTIFAYGHTGAGKTFTMFGDSKRNVQGIL